MTGQESKREFAFSVAIRQMNIIKDLKIGSDYKNAIELSVTLMAEEISLVEEEVLRIAGEFGTIDLGLSRPELKKILEKKVKTDERSENERSQDR
jgi:hypothetical protein